MTTITCGWALLASGGDCRTGGAAEAIGIPAEGGPYVPYPYGGGSDGFTEFATQMHMELVSF